jgi:hypothetical protein
MPFAGIDALIAVTQSKVDNANNAAMDGATKQQKLVSQQTQDNTQKTTHSYQAAQELSMKLRMLKNTLSAEARSLLEQSLNDLISSHSRYKMLL